MPGEHVAIVFLSPFHEAFIREEFHLLWLAGLEASGLDFWLQVLASRLGM